MKTPHRAWMLLIFAFVTSNGRVDAATPDRDEIRSATATTVTKGIAVWYRVPVNSLARRRAKPTEFTAAHNHLPIGTLVRVTRISNCQDVIVRITDRGITDRHATIDLCKEAAARLGMLRAGVVRVSLEVIPESQLGSASAPGEFADQ